MSKEDKMIGLLEEILLWTKYDFEETKQKMIQELDTDDKKIAYQLSDGENSSRDIANKVNVTHKTIQNWWNNWFEAGLVEQTEKYGGGRYKKFCSLTKMGILIPNFEEIDS